MTGIGERKASHLELCTHDDVEGRHSSLLGEVHLLHDALPELSLDEVDPGLPLFGRALQAPLLISGMTGGTPEAERINRDLAAAAAKCGLGMGVGSQRAMFEDAAGAEAYGVRDVAPDIPLLANIGAVQARDAGPERVARLVEDIGADALCVHLNAAQELVQDEGDRDFRGCLAALGALAKGLPVPVVAKETGCGLAPRPLARLACAGVGWVDVSGLGGTSWTAVEALRGSPRQRALGQDLREWGVPTAASIGYARRAGLRVIASGGIRGPADVAASLALGAEVAGAALPFLRAQARGGVPAVVDLALEWSEALRSRMLLTGARRPGDLASAPRVLGPHLRAWLDAFGPAE